jgi:hypothetical protein
VGRPANRSRWRASGTLYTQRLERGKEKGGGLPGFFIIRGVLAFKACARTKRPCSQVAARALTAALRRVFPLHRQSAGIEAREHHA